MSSKAPKPAPKGYTFLGEGTYNYAYRSDDGKTVLKIAKTSTFDMDTPERSVRVWNEINHELKPEAALYEVDGLKGWTCPFVEGTKASDQQISNLLLDVFNNTGRIVLDALVTGNCVVTPDAKVVLIDIGQAIRLDKSETPVMHPSSLTRSRSEISLIFWGNMRKTYDAFLDDPGVIKYPGSRTLTKALLYIQENCPEIHNASFLTEEKSLMSELASAYSGETIDNILNSLTEAYTRFQKKNSAPLSDEDRADEANRVLRKLISDGADEMKSEEEILPLTLEDIKSLCLKKIEAYEKDDTKKDLIMPDFKIAVKYIPHIRMYIQSANSAQSLYDPTIEIYKQMLENGLEDHSLINVISDMLLIAYHAKELFKSSPTSLTI